MQISPRSLLGVPSVQWRREGGSMEGMRPGRHCAGGGILRGENKEFRNLVASGELAFALQTDVRF